MLLKSLLAFTLLGSALATSVVPREPLSLNPPVSVTQQHQDSRRGLNANASGAELDARAPSPSPVMRMTNAERMVAGLPPLPPRRRGSRTSNAARSAPSPGGPALHGYIAAKRAGTDTLLGYVAHDYNVFGENGLTNPSNPVAGALKVILPAESERTGPFNLEVEDPVMTSYPFLGFISGFSNTSPDLSTGKFNYLYLGGVKETPAYSPPADQPNSFSESTTISARSESAIWHYENTTGQLTPQWINTGGSIPSIFYGYVPSEQVVIATGDKGAFESELGGGNVQWLDLYYVAIADLNP